MKKIIEKKEVDEKFLKKIYLNVLKAIIVVVYFLVMNLACKNMETQYFERGVQLCTMIFLFISIFIFELAYRKDDDDLAIQGIEILILSAFILTSKHISKKFNFDFKNYSLVASYIFAIYFVLKGIVVYTKGRREMAEDFSDIREIVKKDEPIKKEATKKKKEDADETVKEEIKKEPVKKRTTRKKTDNMEKSKEKIENKKEPVKKRTTRKKADNIEKSEEKIEHEKETAKKKASRKKTENIDEKKEAKIEPAKKRTPKKDIDKKEESKVEEKKEITKKRAPRKKKEEKEELNKELTKKRTPRKKVENIEEKNVAEKVKRKSTKNKTEKTVEENND